MCWRLWLFSMSMLLFCFDVAAENAQSPSEVADAPKAYDALVWKVFNGGSSAFEDYLRLEQIFETLPQQDKRRLAQLQATADAIYGDYALAEKRHALAFSERHRSFCPTNTQPQPADRVILGATEESDVALFNELHTLVYARAYFLSLLTALRQQGYNTLALEALYPVNQSVPDASNGLPKADVDIDRRKMPLDSGLGGVYTREPIYAELIRQAYRLGFNLIAYDPPDAQARDAREAAQASVLAKIASQPGNRVLVLAGGSHIWKTEGWMAQHLHTALPDRRIVSVDLSSGYQGCETVDGRLIPADGVGPVAMRASNGLAWSDHPERTDLAVFMNVASDRTVLATWLYKPRAAFPIHVDARLCGGKFPCLIEARRVNDLPDVVPTDRVIVRTEDKDPLLYLGIGDYIISIGGVRKTRKFLLVVSPKER